MKRGTEAKHESPLVVNIIYALDTGGLENGLVNIINRTPNHRYRHAIICITKSGRFASRINSDEVPIIELNKPPGNGLLVYWRLWKALKKLKPKIVHTRNIAALEMQLIAFFIPGTRRVHGEHGRDIYDLDGSNRKFIRLRRLLNIIIHKFITVSKDLEHWLVDNVGINRRKVSQIYNGVDLERFSSTTNGASIITPKGFIDSNTFIVGTVGRMAEVKDQSSLVTAFKFLVEHQPDLRSRLRLMIIGDGPLFEQIRAQVDTSGLSDIVWLTGNRDDVPELLNLMDLFVLTSLGEGISNTILEAMATGLPIVATDVGGNPELVKEGENGNLVPTQDPQALATTILWHVTNPQHHDAMRLSSLALVKQQFDWNKTVDAYLHEYDELLARGAR